MDLAPLAQKLARRESLTPEDVQTMQQAIAQYGVHNAAKMLEATTAGLQQAASTAPMAPAPPESQEEMAMNQAFNSPAALRPI
jgi:hypothetical protein